MPTSTYHRSRSAFALLLLASCGGATLLPTTAPTAAPHPAAGQRRVGAPRPRPAALPERLAAPRPQPAALPERLAAVRVAAAIQREPAATEGTARGDSGWGPGAAQRAGLEQAREPAGTADWRRTRWVRRWGWNSRSRRVRRIRRTRWVRRRGWQRRSVGNRWNIDCRRRSVRLVDGDLPPKSAQGSRLLPWYAVHRRLRLDQVAQRQDAQPLRWLHAQLSGLSTYRCPPIACIAPNT